MCTEQVHTCHQGYACPRKHLPRWNPEVCLFHILIMVIAIRHQCVLGIWNRVGQVLYFRKHFLLSSQSIGLAWESAYKSQPCGHHKKGGSGIETSLGDIARPCPDISLPVIWFIKSGLVYGFIITCLSFSVWSVVLPGIRSDLAWKGPDGVSRWPCCSLHAFPQSSSLLKGLVEVLMFGHCCCVIQKWKRYFFPTVFWHAPTGLRGNSGAEVCSAFRNSTVWLPVQDYAEAASLVLSCRSYIKCTLRNELFGDFPIVKNHFLICWHSLSVPWLFHKSVMPNVHTYNTYMYVHTHCLKTVVWKY